MAEKKVQPAFRVGDRVTVGLGRRRVHGVITEDRGPLGIHGRRLFQVTVPVEPDEPMLMERDEDEIEPSDDAERTAPLEESQIVDYLVRSGLRAILMRSLVEGRGASPRTWLCRDTLGKVVYTLREESGLVGGAPAPFGALRDDKIVEAKRPEVLALLMSFGLSRKTADEVIARVGTTR